LPPTEIGRQMSDLARQRAHRVYPAAHTPVQPASKPAGVRACHSGNE
jgi:hypothetical protein